MGMLQDCNEANRKKEVPWMMEERQWRVSPFRHMHFSVGRSSPSSLCCAPPADICAMLMLPIRCAATRYLRWRWDGHLGASSGINDEKTLEVVCVSHARGPLGRSMATLGCSALMMMGGHLKRLGMGPPPNVR